jgi:PAS domain S-box-containing protein
MEKGVMIKNAWRWKLDISYLKMMKFRLLFIVSILSFSPLLLNSVSVYAQDSGGVIEVRVGVYDNSPKIYIADGEVKGFWADITNYIAEQEGWKIEYVHGTWSEGRGRLESGEIDVMVDVAVTESRKEKYDFATETVLVSWSEIYALKESNIESFFDLKNKNIGVLKGSVKAVKDGRADVGVTNMIFGGINSEKYGLKRTPIMFRPSEISYALPKGGTKNNQIIERIDYHISRLKKDSESIYFKSIDRHFYGIVEEQVDLDFTEEEKAWLSEHKDIRIGVDPAFAPFEFITVDGEYRGIVADHLKLISERIGIKLEPVADLTWTEVVEKARRGEIDVLPAVGITEERKQFLSYTRPYLSFPRVIITRTSAAAQSLADLKDLRVAVQKDSSHHGFVREQTTIEPILYDTFQEAMLALSGGEVDAVIGNLAVATHTIQTNKLTNLKIAGHASKESFPLAMAVRKDWPELVSIFNKALDSISEDTRIELTSKWVPIEYSSDLLPRIVEIELNAEEQTWIDEHPVIRVAADPNYAPVEFIGKDGEYQGISVDYLKKISELLGVEFQYSKVGTWAEAVSMFERRELDIFSAVANTPERQQYANFTTPYLTLTAVIFTRDDISYIGDLNELNGRKVAVVKGYATVKILEQDYPNIILVETQDMTDSLEKLASGEVDALIETLMATGYYIRQEGYQNLKVSGETPYSAGLSIASRSDWPILAKILQKSLDAISEEEHDSIMSRWVAVTIEKPPDYSLIWKILGVAFVILAVFTGWNYSLRREKTLTQITNIELKKAKGELEKHREHLEELVEERSAKLADSEEKYRNLVETSPDMIFIIDRKSGKILDINDAASKLLGYKKDEIIGTISGDRIIPSQKDSYNRELERLKKTGRFRGEFNVRKKDGSVMPVDVRGASFGDYRFAMGTDITERKKAEKAIRESEEKFRNLYQTAQVGLFRTRISDGKMLECNDKLAQIAGYDKPEDAIADYVASEHYVDPTARKEMLTELKKSGGVRDFEAEITRRDGTPIWISFSAHLYPQEDYLEGVLIDITDRKFAEKRIRHYIGELETLAQIDQNIINNPDLASILSFVLEKVVELTGSDVAFFGFVEGDVIRFKTFYGISDVKGWDFELKKEHVLGLKVDEQKKPVIIEEFFSDARIKTSHHDGLNEALKKEGLVSFLAVPFMSSKGNLIGILVVASRKKRRYTKQIRTLETLAGQVSVAVEHAKLNVEMKNAYKELKTLDRFKSDIISNVGHELRTPIDILSNSLELLNKEEDIESRNQLMDMALQALNRQNQIVDDLVTAAVYAKKKIELNLEPVDIGQLITLVYAKFKSMAKANKLELSIKIEKNIPIISADFNHIEHVLRNLVNNALKFSAEGGKIVIEAKKKKDMITVCVSDTGEGISEDKLEHIFEPLYKTDTQSTRLAGGIGMGLAVAKEIVMAHGGEITAESKVGKGSRFCISLLIEVSDTTVRERYLTDIMRMVSVVPLLYFLALDPLSKPQQLKFPFLQFSKNSINSLPLNSILNPSSVFVHFMLQKSFSIFFTSNYLYASTFMLTIQIGLFSPQLIVILTSFSPEFSTILLYSSTSTAPATHPT